MKTFLLQQNQLVIFPPKNLILIFFLLFLALLLSPIYFLFIYEVFIKWQWSQAGIVFIFFYSLILLGLYSLFFYKKNLPKKVRINQNEIVFEFSKQKQEIIPSKSLPYFGFIFLQRKSKNSPYLFFYNDKKNILISLIEFPLNQIQNIIHFLKEANFQYWNEQKEQNSWMDEYNILDITKNNFLFFDEQKIQDQINYVQIKKEKYLLGTLLMFATTTILLILVISQVVLEFRFDLVILIIFLLFFFWIFLRGLYQSFFNIELVRKHSELLIYKTCNLSLLPIQYLFKRISLQEPLSTFLKVYFDVKVSKIQIFNQKALRSLETRNTTFFDAIKQRIQLSKEIFEIDLFNKSIQEIFFIYNQINQMLCYKKDSFK